MCGRVFQTLSLAQLLRIAQASQVQNAVRYSGGTYNVCPTAYLPAIRRCQQQQKQQQQEEQQQDEEEEQISDQNEKSQNKSPKRIPQIPIDHQEESKINPELENFQLPDDYEKNPNRQLDFMKWGHDAGFQLIINARVEELQDKKTFRPLLNKNRCVVIVQGFFEWNLKKELFVFKNKNEQKDYLYIAALHKNEQVFLLTREATKEIQDVHHRMPVLLEENEIDIWLNSENDFMKIIDPVILNYKSQKWNSMKFYKGAAKYVNDVKSKSIKCIMTQEDYQKELDKTGIKNYFTVKPKETNEILKVDKIQQNTENNPDKEQQLKERKELKRKPSPQQNQESLKKIKKF